MSSVIPFPGSDAKTIALAKSQASSAMASRVLRGHQGNLQSVNMWLTDQDIENAKEIQRMLKSDSLAQAVSEALALTQWILTTIEHDGATRLLEISQGKISRIIINDRHHPSLLKRFWLATMKRRR